MKAKFIVFEGLDGSGKTLQIQLLKKSLPPKNFLFTKEHTSGPVGSLIDQVVTQKISLNHFSLQLLFVADRFDHLHQVILPALKQGKNVVSDRYFWSTVAYGPPGCPKTWLLELNRLCLKPDFVFFLDVSPQTALSRIQKSRSQKTIFESLKTLSKVRENYLWLAKKFASNCVVLDGEQSPEKIHSQILEHLNSLLPTSFLKLKNPKQS